MSTTKNPFANFSKYQFAADGTVTRNGKEVSSEATPKGAKYRLTADDGSRPFVYAADVVKALAGGEHAEPIKTETALAKTSGTGRTVDLSEDEDDAPAAAPAAVKKTAAPKNAAKKAAAPKKAVTPKGVAAPKAAAPKKAAATKEAGTRDWDVLSIVQVKAIKKDLKKRTELIEKGDKEALKEYSYTKLAAKYGKSNSCIVNINFGRIHKDVEPGK